MSQEGSNQARFQRIDEEQKVEKDVKQVNKSELLPNMNSLKTKHNDKLTKYSGLKKRKELYMSSRNKKTQQTGIDDQNLNNLLEREEYLFTISSDD